MGCKLERSERLIKFAFTTPKIDAAPTRYHDLPRLRAVTMLGCSCEKQFRAELFNPLKREVNLLRITFAQKRRTKSSGKQPFATLC